MRMPPDGSSSDVLRSYSVYTLARLKASPDAADLASGLNTVQTALEAAWNTTRMARDRALEAEAARNAADEALDNEVRRVSLTSLAGVGNRREHPSYTRLFPVAAWTLVNLPVVEELTAVRLLEGRLVAEADGTVRTLLDGLTVARETLEKAQAAWQTAAETLTAARTAEMLAREEWRRVYRKTFGALTERFPESRSRVEGFFRAVRTSAPDVTTPEPLPA